MLSFLTLTLNLLWMYCVGSIQCAALNTYYLEKMVRVLRAQIVPDPLCVTIICVPLTDILHGIWISLD